jgi:hypothetical protein
MIAQTVEGEERAWLWTRTAKEYPAYADYQQKTDRKILVVLLRSAAENDELGATI